MVGAGTMGAGVAQSLAQAGHRVLLIDVSQRQLDDALASMKRHRRALKLLGRDDCPPQADVMGNVEPSTDYGRLAEAVFVVENVTENWDVKKKVHARLDAVCPRSTVIGVNTSAISITRVGSVTGRPSQVVGMHFMNPVPLMPVVEVIRGFHTSPDTLHAACSLVRSLGKEPIVVNDSPGFVTNRIMMLTINEAIFLLHENVSTAEDIDRLFKTCFGHKMGPLETADLIGLDTILYSLEVLYESLQEDKYRSCTLLKRMVDAGLLGRKSGAGFYRYDERLQQLAKEG